MTTAIRAGTGPKDTTGVTETAGTPRTADPADEPKSGAEQGTSPTRRKGAVARRLRSSTVILGGMGVLAAALSACGSEPDKRCVDPLTRDQLPSYECGSGGSGSYYYGGTSKGSHVDGGSFNKSSVDRGGFGCSSSSGG